MITILDGGMGQLLQHRSKLPATNMWSAQSMLHEADLVSELHAEYIAAGAEVITINAYAASPERLQERGFADQFEPLQSAAFNAARRAVEQSGLDIKITSSLPPLFNSYNPDLNLDECFACETYAKILDTQPDVDIHLAETLGSLLEVRAVLSAFDRTNKPCWLSVTLDDAAPDLLRSEEPLAEAIALAEEAGVDAFLVNCSMPETITRSMPLLATSGMRFGAYANGFQRVIPLTDANVVVETLSARTDLSPAAYADFALAWVDAGATIIGGCCETDPNHIAELSRRFGQTQER